MKKYDLIIVGGGPAGLSAAIYGARARLKTLVINKGAYGGLAYTTREIVNYPGYETVTGPDLMKDFQQHAEKFGAELLKDEVLSVDFSQELKHITTKKNGEFAANAIILACGSNPRLLNVPGEGRLRGNGVAYCATCDAEFFEDEHVVVIGSSDQAIEEGMYIAKFASKVTIVVLHDEGVLDCNKLSAEKAFEHPKMNFIWNSTIEEVLGDEFVSGVKIKNLVTGESNVIDCQGVFFFVGMIPQTAFLKDSGLLIEKDGYIPVNELMETSIEGVYAAGDNRVKYLRQVVSAAGDGATAAVAAERYIEEVQDFHKKILENDRSVLLTFFDPKNQASLDFVSLLEQTICGKKMIVKVDISRKMLLAKKYGVSETPTLLVLNKGNLLGQIPCVTDKKVLKELLDSYPSN